MNHSFIEEGLRAMSGGTNITIRMAAIAAGLATLGACTTPAAPPPPPPAAPIVEAVPIRPLPPGQASYAMNIPPVNSFGLRETVNLGISDDEKVWHFRSAWNVAALNCLDPQYQPILDGYSSYIKDYARPLKQVNDRIDADYRKEFGKGRSAIQARESQMTMVYNYFALPPRGRISAAPHSVSRSSISPLARSTRWLSRWPISRPSRDLSNVFSSPMSSMKRPLRRGMRATANVTAPRSQAMLRR